MSHDPDKAWFSHDRFGLFIHWGPYAMWGQGEQVLFRQQANLPAYERRACQWNPQAFDARHWAQVAREGGFRYAVLTTRHHDGYCLWDSKLTDFTSVRQAPKRDFVAEYVAAFREAGLRVGLYYSLADWRVRAYWRAVADDPPAWEKFRNYVHGQVDELLSNYGPIDLLWFDGAWPHSAHDWQSGQLLHMIRARQPGIMVNNRLDAQSTLSQAQGRVEAAGESKVLGDFGTPEHAIVAEHHRPWESCQTSTSRLWGFSAGEHWRPTWQLLDMLCEAAGKGGNLLLNVGPDQEGRIPPPFEDNSRQIGHWLQRFGQAIYGTQAGDVTEFTTFGYQTRRDETLYLILRFWHPQMNEVALPHLTSEIRQARWLDTGQALTVRREDFAQVVELTPRQVDPPGYPVIAIDCVGPPTVTPAGQHRLWTGDPRTHLPWVGPRPALPWMTGGANACGFARESSHEPRTK